MTRVRSRSSSEVVSCDLFFDGFELHGSTSIEIVDGVISRISPHEGATDFHVISPGFIDVQMNGFAHIDIASASEDELAELDHLLLENGTTHYVGTLVTAPLEKMGARAARLHAHCSKSTSYLGTHLEGPFLGKAAGAHPREQIVPVDLTWLAALPDSVRLVTMAPEQIGVVDAISFLRANGVIASMGHSLPSRAQIEACVNAGASMATHVFNAMSPVHHRDDSLALAALVDDRITVGLICDTVHVQPDAVKLAFRAKADGQLVLVSDSIAWDADWARGVGVAVSDGAPRLPNGTLAGSCTPLAQCVALAVKRCGIPIQRALRAATSAPAALLGRHELGVIRQGQPCRIVGLDDSLTVTAVV